MRHLNNILKVVILGIWLVPIVSFAQKAETPDAIYDIGAKINEMMLTEVGTLVVASNDGLIGIKPESKEVLFNFTDYGRVKPEELFFPPVSPYVVVSQNGFGGISAKKAVIDYLSGKKLFSTEDNGWKAATLCEVMMPQNKLVVSGQRRADEKYATAVAIYNLDTGAQESFFNLKSGEVVSGRPLLLENSIIIPTTKSLINVALPTGDVLWTTKVDDIKWMVADASETEIYGVETTSNGKNSKIHKVSASGDLLWSEPHKLKGIVSNFEILPQGLAIVSNVDNSGKSGIMKLTSGRSESKIAFLSASNGEDQWEKAPKTKGYVQHFYIMDDGILFGIYEGGINKISFEGATLFKKPLKTGENILTMAETPQGLIYVTESDANIVNLHSGDQVWKKPLKFKRAQAVSTTYDSQNNRYLISADDNLLSIDAASGESTVLAKSKFDGKEDPQHVEVRNDGVLLTSDQNMTLLDWDGNELWHEYKRAPGKSAVGAILAGVTAVATAATAAASYHSANQNRNRLGQLTQRGERYENLGDGMAAASGASIAEMLKKFKATSATQDAQFILTKLDEGVGLVKLNKDTGSLEKEIILKDKKPTYEVDDRTGVLYYQANNQTVYMYDLKN